MKEDENEEKSDFNGCEWRDAERLNLLEKESGGKGG